MIATLPFPDSLPIVGALLGDIESGEVWVRDYIAEDELPGADLDQHLVEERWAVFGPSSRQLGLYRMPRGFRLRDVRGRMIVGVRFDQDGVQSLVIFEKPKGR
ncbi:MAG: hypothetical protein SFV24_22240 [Gemmatimonadales bacterium]|nr:hypothetical protein [Gemmatimonadales bacterium]